jgi:hypothetical protein
MFCSRDKFESEFILVALFVLQASLKNWDGWLLLECAFDSFLYGRNIISELAVKRLFLIDFRIFLRLHTFAVRYLTATSVYFFLAQVGWTRG